LAKKRRPTSFLRSVRDLLDRVSTLDLPALERRVEGAEAAFNRLDRTCRDMRFGIQKLMHPIELRAGDRYALEDRCRALTRPVYLGNNTALCRVLCYYKMYLDTRDTGFASNLLLDGFWEMWVTIFLARQVQTGMTVIDVGANFGYYTMLFGTLVGPEGHVVAVEPNPEIVPILRRSLKLNGLAERTTLIAAAATAAEGGDIEMFVPEGEPKNGRIVAVRNETAPEPGTFYWVPRARLGDIAAARPRIDLVKIDAEGGEEDIIADMEEVLRRDKPRLLLEFNPGRYHDPAAFLDRLGTVYKHLRYVDFDSDAKPVDVATILNDRSGEDWLLFFDDSPAQTWTPTSAVAGRG
jgi:FkbM family methyltransferase